MPTSSLQQLGKLFPRDSTAGPWAFPVAARIHGEPTQEDSRGNIQERAVMFGWTLLIAASIVHAQDTPPATAVGPRRTGVAVTCPDGHTIPAGSRKRRCQSYCGVHSGTNDLPHLAGRAVQSGTAMRQHWQLQRGRRAHAGISRIDARCSGRPGSER